MYTRRLELVAKQLKFPHLSICYTQHRQCMLLSTQHTVRWSAVGSTIQFRRIFDKWKIVLLVEENHPPTMLDSVVSRLLRGLH